MMTILSIFKYGVSEKLTPFSYLLLFLFLSFVNGFALQAQVKPDDIRFVRQGVRRLVFEQGQAIPLAKLEPANIAGLHVMHPYRQDLPVQPRVFVEKNNLTVQSEAETQTAIWFGGFNPFATYSLNIDQCSGSGELGLEFTDVDRTEEFLITTVFKNKLLTDVKLKLRRNAAVLMDKSISVAVEKTGELQGVLRIQMLGSGLVVYLQHEGLPKVIGQADFGQQLDLRDKKRIANFQSRLFVKLNTGKVSLKGVDMALTTGVGQADIRAITYENGDPFLDKGRLWYTMTIRGRALPHHIQGVFSMDPTVFDVKLEGIILFDRNDGLLRNEVASHIFYDRNEKIWRGLTTGFSAYADPEKEKKQLLAVESKRDPRFGFSVMSAKPFGIVGDIEDPHILFDVKAKKWRMLTCENNSGYKAVLLESDHWDSGYRRIAGPVKHNSTGTSIQKIGNELFCFSGSSDRKIFVYTYPDLLEAGTLKMDLPPWDQDSGTRVWPNVVELPEGYPFRFVALMMDRINYPGMTGPNWSYGALYLYHGN